MPRGKVGVADAGGRRWPDERSGPWAVRLEYASRDGRRECVGLHIQPLSATCPPLTTKVLRSLSLRDAMLRDHAEEVQRARKALRRVTAPPLGEHADDKQLEMLRSAATSSPPIRRRGRPPMYGPEFYRQVAEYYDRMLAAAATNPTQRVADEWKVERTTAAAWVREARRRNHLPPTVRGQARGRDEGTTR